jgi:Flp pilus assembly CpaF family ATPase
MATTFDDSQHLVRVLDRLVTIFGETLDVANPSVHFKTPDGSPYSQKIMQSVIEARISLI